MERACWIDWAPRRGCRTWALRPGPEPMVERRVRRSLWWKWQKALVESAGDWQRRPLVLMWRQSGYTEWVEFMEDLSG